MLIRLEWNKVEQKKVKKPKVEETYQDEVGLISGEHEDGDVLLGQRGDDRLGDLRHTNSLWAAGGVAIGDHVEWQPDGALHLEMLWGLELWVHSRVTESVGGHVMHDFVLMHYSEHAQLAVIC